MIDIITIIIYFVLILIIGWFSRNQTTKSFWVANRQYGVNRITASLVATVLGASSTIGVIGLGYSRGLTAVWWLLIGSMALIVFSFILAKKVRNLNLITLPDILTKFYGSKTAIPAGLMISIAWCGVIAAQMIAGGRLVEGLFGINFNIALSIVSLIFIIYTYWGGQLSVIKTDFIQLIIFIISLILVYVAIHFLSDNQVVQISGGHFSFPVNSEFGWYDLLVYYPLIVGLPYLVGPDIYSRVLSAKDSATARKSALIAAIIIIPIAFILADIGIFAFYNIHNIAPESAFSEILNNYVPVGLKGLIIVGFLGAIMSSADTCLVSAGTILTLNVLGINRNLTDSSKLKLTRTAIIIIGIISWLIATFEKGIISSLLLGYTVFVGGVVIPTLAGFWKDKLRLNSYGAIWAIIIGGLAALLGKIDNGYYMLILLPDSWNIFLKNALGYRYLSILPILLSALTLIIVSRFSYKEQ